MSECQMFLEQNQFNNTALLRKNYFNARYHVMMRLSKKNVPPEQRVALEKILEDLNIKEKPPRKRIKMDNKYEVLKYIHGEFVTPSLPAGETWTGQNVLQNSKQTDVYLRVVRPLLLAEQRRSQVKIDDYCEKDEVDPDILCVKDDYNESVVDTKNVQYGSMDTEDEMPSSDQIIENVEDLSDIAECSSTAEFESESTLLNKSRKCFQMFLKNLYANLQSSTKNLQGKFQRFPHWQM